MTTSLNAGQAGPRARQAVRLLYQIAAAKKEPAVYGWPTCPDCGQSCTGMYGKKPRCTRCTTRAK